MAVAVTVAVAVAVVVGFISFGATNYPHASIDLVVTRIKDFHPRPIQSIGISCNVCMYPSIAIFYKCLLPLCKSPKSLQGESPWLWLLALLWQQL